MSDLLIWWTDQAESDEADARWLDESSGEASPDVEVPDYLIDELHSRVGRAGRGRLWVASEVRAAYEAHKGRCEAAFNAGGPVADDLRARSCGGIVVRAEDARWVVDMPGRLTTLDLHPRTR